MIAPYTRVVLEARWRPHLLASPVITDYKEDTSFIFLSTISNSPEECLVFGEQSRKMILGRIEYFME